MSKFKVGDRVGYIIEESDQIDEYGTITEVLDNPRRSYSGAEYRVHMDDGQDETAYEGYLHPEDEVRAKNTKFKQECQTIEAQTKPLLDNAVALIKQAAKISKDNGHQLSEMYELVGGLRNVIDEVGWSSSSLSC